MVYLIHFEKSFKGARHYIGYTKNIVKRMHHHKKGNGSRLLNALNKHGIDYNIVRTWNGDGHLERRLKNCKKSQNFCPICNREKWANNGDFEIKEKG